MQQIVLLVLRLRCCNFFYFISSLFCYVRSYSHFFLFAFHNFQAARKINIQALKKLLHTQNDCCCWMIDLEREESWRARRCAGAVDSILSAFLLCTEHVVQQCSCVVWATQLKVAHIWSACEIRVPCIPTPHINLFVSSITLLCITQASAYTKMSICNKIAIWYKLSKQAVNICALELNRRF